VPVLSGFLWLLPSCVWPDQQNIIVPPAMSTQSAQAELGDSIQGLPAYVRLCIKLSTSSVFWSLLLVYLPSLTCKVCGYMATLMADSQGRYIGDKRLACHFR
jgi:hypothetical protein